MGEKFSMVVVTTLPDMRRCYAIFNKLCNSTPDTYNKISGDSREIDLFGFVAIIWVIGFMVKLAAANVDVHFDSGW